LWFVRGLSCRYLVVCGYWTHEKKISWCDGVMVTPQVTDEWVTNSPSLLPFTQQTSSQPQSFVGAHRRRFCQTGLDVVLVLSFSLYMCSALSEERHTKTITFTNSLVQSPLAVIKVHYTHHHSIHRAWSVMVTPKLADESIDSED
jgi:hypothetical protein